MHIYGSIQSNCFKIWMNTMPKPLKVYMRKHIIAVMWLLTYLLMVPGRHRGAQKKYQTKFKLDIPMTTPRSALDDTIFNPDWTLRQGWRRHKGKDFVGNESWIFTSLENPEFFLDEMQLLVYRRYSFDPVFGNGGVRWRKVEDPPLYIITSKSSLERIAPMCVRQAGGMV